MRNPDVLIVGGGPAGSSWTCSSSIAPSSHATSPARAGSLPGAPETLGLAAEEYAQGRTRPPFTAFRTGRIGGPCVVTRYARPVSYGLRRIELEQYLLERSGARRLTGVAVTRLGHDGASWVVDDEIRAPLVIGAGGHFCPVARFLNGPSSPESVVAAREVEFRMDDRQRSECRVRPERPEIFFSSVLRGYGWCVRKGEYLNVGLGRRDPHRFPAHVAALLDLLERQGFVHRWFLRSDRQALGGGPSGHGR